MLPSLSLRRVPGDDRRCHPKPIALGQHLLDICLHLIPNTPHSKNQNIPTNDVNERLSSLLQTAFPAWLALNAPGTFIMSSVPP